MATRFTVLLAFIVVCLTAALAPAQVTPEEGTIGTTFTVETGVDIGADPARKPKVILRFLGAAAKKKAKTPKARAKVTRSLGGSVSFFVKSANGGGRFSIEVRGTGNGRSIQKIVGELTLAGPRIDAAGVESVAAGGQLTITGRLFGGIIKKRAAPKVFVGGRKAKVKAFSDTLITVVVHKKTRVGVADITVRTKVGSDTLAGSITVTERKPPKNGAKLSGPDRLTMAIDGEFVRANEGVGRGIEVSAMHVTARRQMNIGINVLTGSVGVGNSWRVQQFSITIPVPDDLATLPIPSTFLDDEVRDMTYRDLRASRVKNKETGEITETERSTLWSNRSGLSLLVKITAYDGKRIAGSFSGELLRTAGTGPSNLIVNGGDFVIEVVSVP